MGNLFFGESRFVMNEVEIFKTALTHGQGSLDDAYLKNAYAGDPAAKEAYRAKLKEEPNFKDEDFETKWEELGRELQNLGGAVAEGLTNPPATTSAPAAGPPAASSADVSGTQEKPAADTSNVPKAPEKSKVPEDLAALLAVMSAAGSKFDPNELRDAFGAITGNAAENSFDRNFTLAPDGTMKIDFTDQSSDVLGKLQNAFAEKFGSVKEKLAKFAAILETDADNVVTVFSNIYAMTAAKKLLEAMKGPNYDYNTFLAQDKDKNKISTFRVTMVSASEVKVELVGDGDVVERYNAYVASKKPADGKDATVKPEEQNQANEIEKTAIGKVLKFFGYGDVGKDGLTGFQRIAKGEDFLGAFLLGIFGYSQYAPQYEDILSSSPRIQALVRPWEKVARESGLAERASRWVGEWDNLKARWNPDRVNADQFGSYFTGTEKKKVFSDDKAILLTGAYAIQGTLRVKLPKDAFMKVVKPTDLKEKGNLVKEDPANNICTFDNTSNTPEFFEFTGTLPANTILRGKGIELQLVSGASTGTEDASAKPVPVKPDEAQAPVPGTDAKPTGAATSDAPAKG